jgi:hypothetical protein
MSQSLSKISLALIAGCVSLASATAFAQASGPVAEPVTHADQKASKAQTKADKKASIAQAKADKKQADAQADADKAAADAKLKDAKKQ